MGESQHGELSFRYDVVEGQTSWQSELMQCMNIEKKSVEMVGMLFPKLKPRGVDGVYNFFIKRCTGFSLDYLTQGSWASLCAARREYKMVYTGITYLIPKTQDPQSPADYRQITCMPTLYRLVTKLAARELRDYVEAHGGL